MKESKTKRLIEKFNTIIKLFNALMFIKIKKLIDKINNFKSTIMNEGI